MDNGISMFGRETIDSREVAAMVGKQHSHLMRDIEGYIASIERQNLNTQQNPKLDSADFFQKSSYKADDGSRFYPCYLCSHLGCDFIANKMQGDKGNLFTALYTKRFAQMESQVQSLPSMSQMEMIAAIATHSAMQEKQLAAHDEELKQHSAKLEAINERMEDIRSNFGTPYTTWRNQTTDSLTAIAEARGGGQDNYKQVRGESYKALEIRGKCDLKTRLKHDKEAALNAGNAGRAKELNRLDVIEADARLKEIYCAIVKEMYATEVDIRKERNAD
jgi:phage regulator Rha-like protein